MNTSAPYTLSLDVGNSNIYAGVQDKDGKILLRFRKTSNNGASADEYGIFLRSALRENNIDPASIGRIGLCSVVPEVVYSLKRACEKYFNLEPFILKSGIHTGLQIAYRNPSEVGSDRIANAVAVSHIYPGQNCIVVDFGTATTFDIISGSKKYLGGAIAPGLRISMEALEKNTARLPSVEIVQPSLACGRSTTESIQAGLYYGHLGMVREMKERIGQECFAGQPTLLLATGGFSALFTKEPLFDAVLPDLVLDGIFQAMKLNQETL